MKARIDDTGMIIKIVDANGVLIPGVKNIFLKHKRGYKMAENVLKSVNARQRLAK